MSLSITKEFGRVVMRTAIITGASSGMGREMALAIDQKIRQIEELWLLGRREERLRELANSLSRKCRVICLDLCSATAIRDFEELLKVKNPEIVFLVNAAGFGRMGRISALSLEEQLAMLDINCRALTALCRICLPYMAEKSRIINFASAAAFLPQPGFAVYAAGKSYVLSFSRALNAETRNAGCHVTAVCPGPVRTEFLDLAGKIPSYKRFFIADAKKVVRKALKDSLEGKDVSVYGLGMNLFYMITKIIPHGAILLLFRKR